MIISSVAISVQVCFGVQAATDPEMSKNPIDAEFAGRVSKECGGGGLCLFNSLLASWQEQHGSYPTFAEAGNSLDRALAFRTQVLQHGLREMQLGGHRRGNDACQAVRRLQGEYGDHRNWPRDTEVGWCAHVLGRRIWCIEDELHTEIGDQFAGAHGDLYIKNHVNQHFTAMMRIGNSDPRDLGSSDAKDSLDIDEEEDGGAVSDEQEEAESESDPELDDENDDAGTDGDVDDNDPEENNSADKGAEHDHASDHEDALGDSADLGNADSNDAAAIEEGMQALAALTGLKADAATTESKKDNSDGESEPARSEMSFQDSSSDYDSDVSDVFHLEVESNKTWETGQDKNLRVAHILAKQMRRHPNMPPFPTDSSISFVDIDMPVGLKLPAYHCAFAGCSWIGDARESLEEHLFSSAHSKQLLHAEQDVFGSSSKYYGNTFRIARNKAYFHTHPEKNELRRLLHAGHRRGGASACGGG